MDTFFRTYDYLIDNLQPALTRRLMSEIDWNSRMIGIRGTRGVGKTLFLLQLAKERFGKDRRCLYVNMNHLYFTTHTLSELAGRFYEQGGRVLLIDQIFKYPNWSEALQFCYSSFPELQIIFAGSSAMPWSEGNVDLSDVVDSYYLRGFSFREFLNVTHGTSFKSYGLNEIIANHREISRKVTSTLNPLSQFGDYLHHGFYPFFLERRCFSENLMKTVNSMIESDIFFLKQIELSYYHKIRKLLYILANQSPCSPNVSDLSKAIDTSRATVMNYIKYLQDARLINLLYHEGDEYPKKPAKIYLHNTNLMYPLLMNKVDEQAVRETFFYNALFKDNKLHAPTTKSTQFIVNGEYPFSVVTSRRGRRMNGIYYAVDGIQYGEGRDIPLWLFGFLY
ncbi:MAG: ATP-binding protein [Bacteroidales bacterium]